MCKILIERVSDHYPMAIQYLEGYEVEAALYEPLKIPTIPLSGTVTVQVAVVRCPIALLVNPLWFWIVKVSEIVRVLQEQRFELVAYRFKQTWGERNAFPLPVGDPGLSLKKVA